MLETKNYISVKKMENRAAFDMYESAIMGSYGLMEFDSLNTPHLFYTRDENEIKILQFADFMTAMNLYVFTTYNHRKVRSVNELRSLDTSGKSAQIVIPGFRAKGRIIHMEAAKRLKRYRIELSEVIIKKFPKNKERDEFIKYLLVE